MAIYKKPNDKKSGDGLALTEWNDLSSAVAGNAGLTLAISPDDKIGIGTTSPQEKLQVGNFQAADQYISVTAAGGNRYKTGLKLSVWKKDYGFVMEHDETKVGLNFRFHNPDVPSGSKDAILFLSNFGNVGVGTTTPAEKLDVEGNVKAAKFIGDGSQLTNLSM
jgi:hypothetical protein